MIFWLLVIFWFFGVITLTDVFCYWFGFLCLFALCEFATWALIYSVLVRPFISFFGG